MPLCTVDVSASGKTEMIREDISEVHDVYVEPIYRDVVTEEMLEAHALKLKQKRAEAGLDSTESDGTEYCANINEAVSYVRQQLVARNEETEFLFPISEYTSTTFKDIYYQAVAHSESCKGWEGDSLRYTTGGFSASGSFQYSDSGVSCYRMSYTFKLYTTAADEKLLTQDINAALKSLNLSGKSELEKIRAIHDYICDHVEYDHEHLGNNSYKYQFTSFAALHNGTAVCQGYATLFYRMAKESGLSVRVVTSDTHAWNIVKKGNLYYNLDTTWDDQSSYISNGWFMKGDREILDDSHAREQEFCTDAFYASYPMVSDPALNAANQTASFTSTDGSTKSSAANGKGKILVFGKFDGEYWEKVFLSALTSGNISDLDFYIIDCAGLTKDDLKDIKDSISLNGSVWCYDTEQTVKQTVSSYLNAGGFSGSYYYPVIAYIDKNNNLQHFTTGYIEPERFRLYVDTYIGGTKPSIKTQPQDVTVAIDSTVKLTVAASGSNLTYQWQYRNSSSDSWKNSTMTCAKTDTFTFTAAESHSGHQYRCNISNANGTVTTRTATVTVRPRITTQPAEKVSVTEGGTVKLTVAAKGTNLKYQWQYRNSSTDTWKNSTMDCAKTTTFSFIAAVNHSGHQYRCGVSNGKGTTYTKTITVTVTPKITKQPSTSVTVALGNTVKLVTAATGTNVNYQSQYRNSSTDTWKNSTMACAKTTTFSFTAAENHSGHQYRCAISNGKGTAYTNTTTVTVTPKITTQPAYASVAVDCMAKFTVVADGTNLTYQWQYRNSSSDTWKNSTMTCAKTDTFTFNVAESHYGHQYRCVISNGKGKAYSNAATVTVRPLITTQPKDTTVSKGATVKLTVEAKGTNLTYQWQYRNSSTDTWKNSTMACAKTNTFSFTAAASHSGHQYRCAVSNGKGTTYTKTAAVTVK